MAKKLDSNAIWNLLPSILKIAMAVVYIVLGVLIILKQWFLLDLNIYTSWALGLLLVVYGGLRFFRVLRTLKS